jgi:pyruvate carboxylase
LPSFPLSLPACRTPLDTGIDPQAILPLNLYWEQTRELYAPFEVRVLVLLWHKFMQTLPAGVLV